MGWLMVKCNAREFLERVGSRRSMYSEISFSLKNVMNFVTCSKILCIVVFSK